MRLLRLRGRKTCDRLLRQGTAWKGRNMVIRWMAGHPRHPSSQLQTVAVYVGTLASTKLDKSAVTRNRMRRRCREALRLVLLELAESARAAPTLPVPPTLQLLIAPRSSSLKAPFADLQADVRAFLSSRTHARTETRFPKQ